MQGLGSRVSGLGLRSRVSGLGGWVLSGHMLQK